jgi:vanillate O-demethylase monooxygenase subunit
MKHWANGCAGCAAPGVRIALGNLAKDRDMNYLRNSWYVAAWAEEVIAGGLFHRTLLDQPLLLVHALTDRCPHRFAPLHLGRVVGDRIQCGYHGLEFDAQGRCVHNPHVEGTPPASIRVASYPLVERHSLLWIWMGDAARADPAAIPDFSFQDPAHCFVGKRYLHARANYVLEIDNILDLSHIQYLHPTTLGSGDVSKGSYTAEAVDDTVWSRRTTHAEIMPEFMYRACSIPVGTPSDRWVDVRWNAPANMALFAGALPTGVARRPGDGVSQAHIFTPETERTTHYWFSISFPRAMGAVGARLAEEQIDALKMPFETEDLPMLEAQQRSIDALGGAAVKPLLFKVDAAAAHAHRILDRLLAEESA